MASVNKVILVGNLGKDPEVRYMPNGDAVCNLTLATTDSWKDKEGNKQEATEWHRVALFRRLGEIAGQYLKKGSQIYIEGAIRTRKWQDKEGKDRYTTEIHATDMKMLGSREGGGNSGASNSSGGDSRPAPGNTNGNGNSRPPAQNSAPAPANAGGGFQDFEDDIPFAGISKKLALMI